MQLRLRQTELKVINAAIQEDKEYNFSIDFRKVPNNVFRGTVDEFLIKSAIDKIAEGKNSPIDTVMLTGRQIRSSIFSSNVQWDTKSFCNFMKVIAERQIKVLNLEGCELTPKIGALLGQALKTNTSLKILLVTSNQLESEGIVSLFDGLKNNTSLQELYCRGYNCQAYYWLASELNALKNLIIANNTLKKIDVTNNGISNRNDKNSQAFQDLIDLYRSSKNRELPAITNGNFSFNINQDNVKNVKFDQVINNMVSRGLR